MNPTIQDEKQCVESLVGQVADEFTECLNRGEHPDIEEYVRRYPEIATILRQALPALQAVGSLVPGSIPSGEAALEQLPPAGCLGDFRILHEIGRGGMGVVYEAEQISLGRRVALKVLPFAATLDPKQLQRFKNEAQAAAHLHHTNIVPVFGVGVERGVHYYAMQYIEGQTLAAMIRELRQLTGLETVDRTDAAGVVAKLASELVSGRWAPARPKSAVDQPTGPYAPAAADHSALSTQHPAPVATPQPAAPSTERSTKSRAFFRTVANLGVQAAEALEHAHSLGVVHRDIKPANLLVDLRGILWITDFGLAHCQSQAGLTMTGDLVGTLRYMSPEQALAKRVLVDHRTDIYSLGASLYELLTLEPVFSGRDRQELLRQIAFEDPRPLRRLNKAIPPELETIVLKAVEKNPADRYATAQEFADDLERYLKDESIRARRPTLVQRLRKWSRRHKPVVVTAGVAAAVVMLLAVVALAIGYAAVSQEKDQKDAALKQAKANEEAAQAQRRNARRAVDKMFTQVAEKWLGRDAGLELLQREFLEDALRFYQEFANEQDTDPDGRLEIALAYSRVAGIQSSLGKQAKPEDASNKAIALLEELVAEFPWEARYRLALAESHGRHGFLLSNLGRAPEGLKPLRQAVLLLKELGAEFPDLPEYRQQLATNLCTLTIVLNKYPEGGKSQEAVETGRAALELFAKLPAKLANSEDCRWDVCNTTGELSNALITTGQVQEGEEGLQRTITLYEKLVDDFPYEPTYQVDLVYHLFSWGNRFRDRKPQEAEKALRKAVAIAEKVMARFPTRDTVAAYHLQATAGYYEFGIRAAYGGLVDFLKNAKRHEDAAAVYYQAVECYEKLVVAGPNVEFYRGALLEFRNGLASLLRTIGRTEEVEKVYRHAVSFWEKHASELSEAHFCRQELAHSYGELGNFLSDTNRRQEAETNYRKAIELKPDEVMFHYWLALARVEAGDLAGHRSACAAMLECFGSTDNADVAHWVAWTSVLAPDAVKDLDQPVKLAERAVRGDPKNDIYTTTLGCALYRARRFSAAIQLLREASAAWDLAGSKPTRHSPTYTWFFLAMAEERLGHAEEARRWLDKAIKWMEQETQNKELPWNRRLTLQLLRREAEALVKGAVADQEKAKETEKPHAKAPSREELRTFGAFVSLKSLIGQKKSGR